MSTEYWRAIPGVDGYEASSIGRVRSVDRTVMQRKHGAIWPIKQRGKLLKPWADNGGYLVVTVGGQKKIRVHTCVILAFVGLPPSPEHQCAHWNGDPSDNRHENLRWALPKENMEDQVRHRTKVNPPVHIGEAAPTAKLTSFDVNEIRAAPPSITGPQLAERFGVTRSTINRIRSGKYWKHI